MRPATFMSLQKILQSRVRVSKIFVNTMMVRDFDGGILDAISFFGIKAYFL